MTPEERDDLCFLPATEIVAAVAARRLSPVELVDAVLDRMAEINPLIGAFCTPAPERARARAALLADTLARGGTPGPLAGVPLGVKDLIATKGLLTTFGSPAYRDHVPDQDDIVVERSTGAGAVVLGKTNTTEFGYSPAGHNPLFPPSRNPWRTGLTPADRAPDRRRRWPPASDRWRWAATADAPCGCPRPSANWSASNRRWAACPSGPAAATNACPAPPAGRASSISAS